MQAVPTGIRVLRLRRGWLQQAEQLLYGWMYEAMWGGDGSVRSERTVPEYM
jgi:hypothetical protein